MAAFRAVPSPVDCTDAAAFPEIARAIEHARRMKGGRMMADWQVGDLALSLSNGKKSNLVKGRIYTVVAVTLVSEWRQEIPPAFALTLDKAFQPENHLCGGYFHEKYFRKITPPAADADDREVIALLTGKPVEVGA